MNRSSIKRFATALLAVVTFSVAFAHAQGPAYSTKTRSLAGGTTVSPQGKPASTVAHDATLSGDGTAESPLGVTVPLSLSALVAPSEAVINGYATGSGTVIGVKGTGGTGGTGVFGSSQSGDGVFGASPSGSGVSGASITGNGVFGSTSSGIAILGLGGSGLAGRFNGNVMITGSLSKGGGSFKIDHPLDPENKYLYHSFVESPDMKNVYDGVTTLDGNGETTIELPEWFEALNRDFRYLLTPIGAPAPGLYVADKISRNRFRVSGGLPGMEVSWQVTGIRQDAWANKNRIPVEEEKSARERGYYLYPELYDQPEYRSVDHSLYPELMKAIKARNK
jgi:hypothetical protein